jgi:hypothetical protein
VLALVTITDVVVALIAMWVLTLVLFAGFVGYALYHEVRRENGSFFFEDWT